MLRVRCTYSDCAFVLPTRAHSLTAPAAASASNTAIRRAENSPLRRKKAVSTTAPSVPPSPAGHHSLGTGLCLAQLNEAQALAFFHHNDIDHRGSWVIARRAEAAQRVSASTKKLHHHRWLNCLPRPLTGLPTEAQAPPRLKLRYRPHCPPAAYAFDQSRASAPPLSTCSNPAAKTVVTQTATLTS